MQRNPQEPGTWCDWSQWRVYQTNQDTELQVFNYGIIGIGDTFAYTILKNYKLSDCSIERGKIVAYRVIRDAIDVGAYGLGEPIDIWTINQPIEEILLKNP